MQHPTRPELRAFLESSTTHIELQQSSRIIQHLLAGCTSCRAYLRALQHPVPQALDEELPTDEETLGRSELYDGAFHAAEEALAVVVSGPLRKDDLAQVVHRARHGRPPVGNARRLPFLVKWAVAQSHASRYEDPEAMLLWADLARIFAEECTPEIAGSPSLWSDLSARAWGQFGNALRVRGHLPEAKNALDTAHRFYRSGTGDQEIRGRLLQQTVSFLVVTDDFDAAEKAAEEAGRVFLSIGDLHQFASALVQRAIAALYVGEPERALLFLKRALPFIEEEEDPDLLVAVRHNLARCFLDLWIPQEVIALSATSAEITGSSDSPLVLRTMWQRGQLLRDLGHLDAAERILLQTRSGFVRRHLPHEAALVSLELIETYLKQGVWNKVEKTAKIAMPLLSGHGYHRAQLALRIQMARAQAERR